MSQGTSGSGEHPSAEELMGMAQGSLEESDGMQIRNHLRSCDECSELVRDLSSYPDLELPGDAYRIDEEELRSTLGALRARTLGPAMGSAAGAELEPVEKMTPSLGARPGGRPEDGRTPPEAQHRGTAGGRGLWLAAAVALLALGWNWHQAETARSLRQEVADLEQSLGRMEGATGAGANVRVSQVPLGDVSRGGPPVQRLTVADFGTLILLQTEEPLPEEGTYMAEVRRRDGTVVRRYGPLEEQTVGFSILLMPAALEPGEHELWLLREGTPVLPAPIEIQVPE